MSPLLTYSIDFTNVSIQNIDSQRVGKYLIFALDNKPNSLTTKKETKMKKYECTVCGYIYDPTVGDPDSGIAPGTPFEEIPDDWTCPLCGVGKEDFQVVE